MTGTAWGLPAAPSVAAAPTTPPVRLLIVAQPAHGQALYTTFASDARFAVQAVATSGADARVKLTLDPELVLAEVVAFANPQEFRDVFAAYRGIVWVIMPLGLAPHVVDAIRQISCVGRVIEGDPNLPELAGQLYQAALDRRPAAGAQADLTPLRSGAAMVGWRAIAVWSPQGGVGKSTLALALALEATARRLPALLVGLGAPDGTPLILDGILPEPNILAWRGNPTVDGLCAARQVHRRTGQHILVGFRDPVSVSMFEGGQAGPASLTNLAYVAAQTGYGIVVFDVSTQELAPAALSAANTLVLVGRADLPGIRAILEGVRLVKDVMAGQHAIPDGAIHLVLNRVRDTTLRPDEVMAFGKRERRDFPPLAAYIADDPAIETAVNQMHPAYYASDPLRQAVRALGDLLFPAALAAPPLAGQPARSVKLGPLRFRW